jgi:DMSO/TMAO reductase YedYZ molybdopterin-dependent catalytic subunit
MTPLRSLLIAALLVVTGVAQAATPSTALAVTGTVDKPDTWTVAALRALPQHDVDVVTESGMKRVYSGPLLRDVLTAAHVSAPDRLALRQTLVVAHATDGYVALFAWAELFNTTTGAQVIVAIARDGAPIDADEGALALVGSADKPSGPRHVHWLDGVDVRRVAK